MIYLFIDTNVVLHFKSFDQYPWKTHFNQKEELTIVFTHPLIEELDKKKYSGKDHLMKRAVSCIKKIENLQNLKTTAKLKYELFNEIITKSYIENLGLDPFDGDDKLIAAMLKFKEKKENKIIFVTNDLGPRLKVLKYGIETIIPLVEQQLKSPENEFDKKLKQLQIDNSRLKNQSPKLSITFQDKSNLKIFEIEQILETKDDFIKNEIINLKTKYSPFKLKNELEKEREYDLKKIEEQKAKGNYSRQDEFKEMMFKIMPLSQIRIREEEKIEYNENLINFYSEYEFYLEELYEYKRVQLLTTEFQFLLNNEGTTPAEDIDIYFHFPNGFELYDEYSYPKQPEMPIQPTKPLSIYDRNLYSPIIPNLFNHKDFDLPFDKPNVSSPSIKKTNSYDVNFNVVRLKHNKIETLDKMFAIFNNLESIINFKVDYEIKCSNVPEVVKGILTFINTVKAEV